VTINKILTAEQLILGSLSNFVKLSIKNRKDTVFNRIRRLSPNVEAVEAWVCKRTATAGYNQITPPVGGSIIPDEDANSV
jgi:hypothetical protein